MKEGVYVMSNNIHNVYEIATKLSRHNIDLLSHGIDLLSKAQQQIYFRNYKSRNNVACAELLLRIGMKNDNVDQLISIFKTIRENDKTIRLFMDRK